MLPKKDKKERLDVTKLDSESILSLIKSKTYSVDEIIDSLDAKSISNFIFKIAESDQEIKEDIGDLIFHVYERMLYLWSITDNVDEKLELEKSIVMFNSSSMMYDRYGIPISGQHFNAYHDVYHFQKLKINDIKRLYELDNGNDHVIFPAVDIVADMFDEQDIDWNNIDEFDATFFIYKHGMKAFINECEEHKSDFFFRLCPYPFFDKEKVKYFMNKKSYIKNIAKFFNKLIFVFDNSFEKRIEEAFFDILTMPLFSSNDDFDYFESLSKMYFSIYQESTESSNVLVAYSDKFHIIPKDATTIPEIIHEMTDEEIGDLIYLINSLSSSLDTTPFNDECVNDFKRIIAVESVKRSHNLIDVINATKKITDKEIITNYKFMKEKYKFDFIEDYIKSSKDSVKLNDEEPFSYNDFVSFAQVYGNDFRKEIVTELQKCNESLYEKTENTYTSFSSIDFDLDSFLIHNMEYEKFKDYTNQNDSIFSYDTDNMSPERNKKICKELIEFNNKLINDIFMKPLSDNDLEKVNEIQQLKRNSALMKD